MLTILGPYRKPQHPGTQARLHSERFVAAATAAGFDPPPLAPELIKKYVADLRYLQLL